MQDMDRICGTIAIVLLALLVYNMHKESTASMRRSVSACSMASKENEVSAKNSLNVEQIQSPEAYENTETNTETLGLLTNSAWNPAEKKKVPEETASMLDQTIVPVFADKLEAHMSSSCNTSSMTPQQIVKKQTISRTTQNDGRQTHARTLGQANVLDQFRRTITGDKSCVKPPKEEMFALNTEAASQARLNCLD